MSVCGLLGAVLVPLLQTLRVKQPVSEGAAQRCQSVLHGVGHVVHKGRALGCHSPFSHYLHGVEAASQDRASLHQSVEVLLPQQTTPQRTTNATTESKKVLRSVPCPPKDLTWPVVCPVQLSVQVNHFQISQHVSMTTEKMDLLRQWQKLDF